MIERDRERGGRIPEGGEGDGKGAGGLPSGCHGNQAMDKTPVELLLWSRDDGSYSLEVFFKKKKKPTTVK